MVLTSSPWLTYEGQTDPLVPMCLCVCGHKGRVSTLGRGGGGGWLAVTKQLAQLVVDIVRCPPVQQHLRTLCASPAPAFCSLFAAQFHPFAFASTTAVLGCQASEANLAHPCRAWGLIEGTQWHPECLPALTWNHDHKCNHEHNHNYNLKHKYDHNTITIKNANECNRNHNCNHKYNHNYSPNYKRNHKYTARVTSKTTNTTMNNPIAKPHDDAGEGVEKKFTLGKNFHGGSPLWGLLAKKKKCRIKLVAFGIFFCMVQILWGKLVNVSTPPFVTLLIMNYLNFL